MKVNMSNPGLGTCDNLNEKRAQLSVGQKLFF